jgi:hypothetical protein
MTINTLLRTIDHWRFRRPTKFNPPARKTPFDPVAYAAVMEVLG